MKIGIVLKDTEQIGGALYASKIKGARALMPWAKKIVPFSRGWRGFENASDHEEWKSLYGNKKR